MLDSRALSRRLAVGFIVQAMDDADRIAEAVQWWMGMGRLF